MSHADLKREYRELYGGGTEPALIEVPPLPVVAVDGHGDPDDAPYRAAVGALYRSAYQVRAIVKREDGLARPVMPLEGLWTADRGMMTDRTPRDEWNWTMLIVLPPECTPDRFEAAREAARRKDPDAPEVRLDRLPSGPAVQILHIGPYSSEKPSIMRMLDFAREHGHRVVGRHQEIYLSDPRRTAPERLRTLIRYGIE
ncbi:hypothetical protein LX16_4681 [Stackebrandtia albiflava]|uniref:GyrI-like small molecule binding domain-containing protein n=1 Tax=Stackebrandtia albiflava TaxID=406432 RepID=A0A562UQK6_9ACTN|nr:GyrI-like domain-containing protein [Stackebrandtia albiflava]TWJ07899.1 hypothetical protein LX16_4681 [Stackebrandtia albiflava]